MTIPSARRRVFPAAVLLLVLGASTAAAQNAVISGLVRTEYGNILEAANVYIPELNISVSTNAQGRYTITIPAERVRGQPVNLRTRSFGYLAQAKPIIISAGPQTHDFSLKQDINRLQEVVVTGVTEATEVRKLPFTVATVTAQDMPVPSSNALSQLQGKVTGATIVSASGRPGSTPSIMLRTPKSINASGRGQGPLIIVDGIILDGTIGDINPQDIESFEVVKGAAASSLYGSRAGNGVIQITTKTGRNAGTGHRFHLRSEYGLSDVTGAFPLARQHFVMLDETNTKMCIKVTGQPACSRVVSFEDEALRINEQGGDFALPPHQFERDFGIGLSPSKPDLKGVFQVNNWVRRYDPIETTATNGQTVNTNIDMSGRFGNVGYFASANNYIGEGAIRFLQGYRRNSFRLNLDQRGEGNWTNQIQSFFSQATTYPDGEWFRLTRVPAGVDLLRRDNLGRLFVRSNPLNQGQQNENPLYTNSCCYGRTDADRFLGSLTSRYSPFAWLDFEGIASLDRRRANGFNLTDRGFRTTQSGGTANLGNASASSSSDLSYNLGFNGTARHRVGDNLDLRLNTRYAFDQQDGSSVSASGTSIAVPGLQSLGNTTLNYDVGSGISTVRAIGMSAGVTAEYFEHYIVEALVRRDGSSLFGSEQRWHNYKRGSVAWRASDEPWWFAPDAINDLKFRFSVGTAGGRPSFSAQYETFSVGAGGAITANALGNKNLKPEITTESEYGIDAEFWGRYGLNVTYAFNKTRDQILPVPPSVASGFSSQIKNAGTMEGKTWEASLNVPLVTNRNVTWTTRLSFDRNRAYITELGVPDFFQTNSSATIRYAVGERYGNVYGKKFVTSCSELPAGFQARCGDGKDWQKNDEGYVVWVGEGNSYRDGITKNLWQSTLFGCVRAGSVVNVTGEVACREAGGTVQTPWGQPEVHWGMLQVVRDSNALPTQALLGNVMPDYRVSVSQNFQYKRLAVWVLADASMGATIMNQELHWSLGDFMVDEEDQGGKTVETAKPLGYYWRAPRPDNGSGVGGFYDVLGSNSKTAQDGSYGRLRELSVSYNIGRIRNIVGEWQVSAIGRNLFTVTDFRGWDPEVGISAGNTGSAAINAVAAYQYPQRREFTFSLASRF